MNRGYLDIDEILAEEERVSCKTLQESSYLGHLNSDLNAVDLPRDSKVDIPLWLAEVFFEKNLVNIELPKGYGIRVRNDILAGPASVRLRDFSYYYFELGFRISELLNDENLLGILRMALCGERFTTLISRALSSWHGDLAEYCQQLTAAELAFFTAGHSSAQEVFSWRTRKISNIQKSGILQKISVGDSSTVSTAATGKGSKRTRE